MITAEWMSGYGFYNGIDAQMCAEEIMSIMTDDGVRPQDIVNYARNPDTELHKCFEWDDTRAAEEYRLAQARQVTRHLVIREREVPTERPQIKFFAKPRNTDGYKPVEKILRNPNEYNAMLTRAWAELHAFKRKYAMLEELQDIFELIK